MAIITTPQPPFAAKVKPALSGLFYACMHPQIEGQSAAAYDPATTKGSEKL
jgi:hypothetical protein